MTFEELKVGDSASTAKTITETDVYLFAGVTGDQNPAHINQVEAEKGIFGERVAHGMLVGSLFSAVLGMKLPGPGTIYLGQELRFRKPVCFGDTITATVTVQEMLPEKKQVVFRTEAVNQEGTLVIDGTARVLPPKISGKQSLTKNGDSCKNS